MLRGKVKKNWSTRDLYNPELGHKIFLPNLLFIELSYNLLL